MAATHATYSFVRLNENGVNIPECFDVEVDSCLPIAEITDVQWQIISSESQTNPQTATRVMIAIPCDSGVPMNAIDVHNYLTDGQTVYQNTVLSATSIFYPGFYSIIFNTTFEMEVGDDVLVALGVGSIYRRGIYQVVHKTSNVQYEINIPYTASIDGPCTFIQLSENAKVIASQPTLLPANSEFSGSNYAWELEPHGGDLNYADGECFAFCIYIIEYLREGGYNLSYLGNTNCFKKISDTCYTTKISYGCNEESFGFYIEGFTNTIRLPMYISRPQYPGEEKGYQKSTGEFVKLKERVNKKYLLQTDWIPEEWHERLRVALSCDFIYATSGEANLTDERIYKSDDYTIAWDERVDFPLAKGQAEVFKTFFSRSVNSNCV